MHGKVIVADMTRRDDVRRTVDETIASCGRVDVWVNHVGEGITRPPSQLTDDDVDFKARGAGHVINITSMLGRIPLAIIRSAYNGAKHFLNALTVNFRTEVQATHPGIQFTLVSPGVVRTEFGKNARHGGPDSRELPDSPSAEEVAAVIAGAIESRTPDVYTRARAHGRVVEYFTSLGADP